MNLHDWIDELCDLLDVDSEADEGLLGDLAEVAHDNVHPAAGPVTAFLLGVAAGDKGAGPDAVERMAARVQALAEAWDRPAGATDEVADSEADGEVEEELRHLDEIDEVEELDEEELDEEEEDLLV